MTNRQPKGTPTGGQFAEGRKPEGSDLPAITRSKGTAVGGFVVGGGYRGITDDLDSVVEATAEYMTTEFNMPVEIRFNSDRRRGGAWLNFDGNTSAVGISANQHETKKEAKEGRYYKSFGDNKAGAQEYLASCDGEVHLDVYIVGEFLRDPNEAEETANGSRRLMTPIGNVGDALTFVREHTIVGDFAEIERRNLIRLESIKKRDALKEKANKDYELAIGIVVKAGNHTREQAIKEMQPAYAAQYREFEQELFDDYWTQIAKGSS